MRQQYKRTKRNKPLTAGSNFPVKLPTDPDEALKYITVLERVPNRNKFILDLIATKEAENRIKRPGDTIMLQLPNDINPDQLYWINTQEDLMRSVLNLLSGAATTKQHITIPSIPAPPLVQTPVQRNEQASTNPMEHSSSRRGRDRSTAF